MRKETSIGPMIGKASRTRKATQQLWVKVRIWSLFLTIMIVVRKVSSWLWGHVGGAPVLHSGHNHNSLKHCHQ